MSALPRTVVITGASGQIGSECVDAFVRQGDRVAAIDALAPARERAAVVDITADLGDAGELERAFDDIDTALGAVDILVQCAAVVRRTSFLDLRAADVDEIFAVNVRAVLLAARRAAVSMVAGNRRGVIVNLSSTSAIVSDAESVAYDASKGAVSTATRAIAVALAPYGIRAIAIAPGAMTRDQEREPRDQRLDSYEQRRIPAGRLGTAADIAGAVTFLTSPQTSYITGTVLYVDGGSLAAW